MDLEATEESVQAPSRYFSKIFVKAPDRQRKGVADEVLRERLRMRSAVGFTSSNRKSNDLAASS
jgi:hypothetical protein